MTGMEELRQAVEPYILEHAARLADVPPRQLQELVASIRRAGRLAIETGTGITMSEDANVVQWLAWVIMILTDSMNRPGGTWFHPGFFRVMDAAPLPQLPAEMFFHQGPPSRPDLPGFLGEWPCAALPSEIEAGNIRAVLNLGGGLLTAFPDERAMRRPSRSWTCWRRPRSSRTRRPLCPRTCCRRRTSWSGPISTCGTSCPLVSPACTLPPSQARPASTPADRQAGGPPVTRGRLSSI